MPTADKLQQARADIDQAAANAGSADELMKSIVERLHVKNGGVPYGIALAAAALAIYPDTAWMTLVP